MGKEIRLDKLLADTGRWSRKEARLLLKQGRVAVQGTVERGPERRVDPEAVRVEVDGVPVSWSRFHYYMLHKPAGVLTATEDRSQPTALDLLPGELRRGLFPVGRLDKDTTGLLLLTDDGALAHRLLSPKYHVDKIYLAEIDGTVDQSDVDAFRRGMALGEDEVCLPAELESMGPGKCKVTLREGKYHQVKRMLAARGKPVTALHRYAMGPLVLDAALEAGNYRELTPEEVKKLVK